MDYVDRWCKKCGAPYDKCHHEDSENTEDAVEAMRIRQIYQGLEIDKDKRTRR